jgi:hypothetical protein
MAGRRRLEGNMEDHLIVSRVQVMTVYLPAVGNGVYLDAAGMTTISGLDDSITEVPAAAVIGTPRIDHFQWIACGVLHLPLTVYLFLPETNNLGFRNMRGSKGSHSLILHGIV